MTVRECWNLSLTNRWFDWPAGIRSIFLDCKDVSDGDNEKIDNSSLWQSSWFIIIMFLNLVFWIISVMFQSFGNDWIVLTFFLRFSPPSFLRFRSFSDLAISIACDLFHHGSLMLLNFYFFLPLLRFHFFQLSVSRTTTDDIASYMIGLNYPSLKSLKCRYHLS